MKAFESGREGAERFRKACFGFSSLPPLVSLMSLVSLVSFDSFSFF
jgi:hypothetical protein